MQKPTWIWGLLVVIAACGKSDTSRPDKGSAAPARAPQTAREAMQIICDAEAKSGAAELAPADRSRVMSEWMRARVTNAEILRALDEASLDTLSSAKTKLVALAKQHGAGPCAIAKGFTSTDLGVQLAHAQGAVEPDTDAPLATVSWTEIKYDGKAIVTLDNGALPPAEVIAGKLAALANAVAAKPPAGRARIAFDRSIPIATATAVIAAFASGDIAKVALVVEQNNSHMLMPLDMAVTKPFEGTLVVGTTKDQLALWSTSGKFGTAKTPHTTAPLDGGLGQIVRGLTEIKAKHGDSGVVMLPSVQVVLDGTLDVERLIMLVGAIRMIFPSVMLSAGFR